MPDPGAATNAGHKVSNPLAELVGEGSNEKYVKACIELYLGARGIEKLQGFERLVNLEVLWLDHNSLQSLQGLESNFRLKELHAEGNSISSLKPLKPLHHLEALDVSGNQLRNLVRLIEQLRGFTCLKLLNILGNACTEEPEYRLQLIHALPSLQILDLHSVTPEERREAAALLGGQAALQTIAFGQRRPAYTLVKVPERSPLEQDLARLAHRVRAEHAAQASAAEQQQYGTDPHPPTSMAGKLPKPPGWAAEMDGNASSSGAAENPPQRTSAGSTLPKQALTGLQGYVAKDVLKQTFCDTVIKPDIPAAGLSNDTGSLRLDKRKYASFAASRARQGQWQVLTQVIKL